MKALVVAYYFPPYGGGSTVRIHSFVKNLPGFGIDPVVLTADDRFYDETYRDDNLLLDYRPGTEILRTDVLFGARIKQIRSNALKGQPSADSGTSLKRRTLRAIAGHILSPDEQILWVSKAARRGCQLLKASGAKVVFSTAPPFSTHVLACIIGQRTNTPVILDYRDLWTTSAFYAATWLNRRLERWVLKQAAFVIVTNEAARRKIVDCFGIPEDNVGVIANGFDCTELDRIRRPASTARPPIRRINYVGSLTSRRTPLFFFKALRRVLDANPAFPVSVGVVGYTPQQHRSLATQYGLDQIVSFIGTVERRRALEIICNESDVLLLLQRVSEGGDTAIPGKVYEYLASGNPILAMDDGGGATSSFLQKLGVRHICDYEDVDSIAKAILDLGNNYAIIAQQFEKIRREIHAYDRAQLTGELSTILHRYAKLQLIKKPGSVDQATMTAGR